MQSLFLIWTDGPVKFLDIQCVGNIDKLTEINFKDTLQKTQDICQT